MSESIAAFAKLGGRAVNKRQRKKAWKKKLPQFKKALRFGLAYGMGARSFQKWLETQGPGNQKWAWDVASGESKAIEVEYTGIKITDIRQLQSVEVKIDIKA